MDFPKKQAQRLMPLYLLEYNEKLFESHPDPEAPWGGGGGDYTAGYGIDITSNEISVDTTVIATKSDISSMVTTTMLEDALDDYALKTDLPENVSELNNDAGYTTQTWVENQGYLTSTDLSGYVTSSELSNQLSSYALSNTVTNLASQVTTLESLVSNHTTQINSINSNITDLQTLTSTHTSQISGINSSITSLESLVNTNISNISTIQNSISTMSSSITTLEGLTSTHTSQISALQTSVSNCVTLSQLSTELSNYTPTSGLASVATTGDYNDLINKPNIVNPHTLASGDLVFQDTGTWTPAYKWFDNATITSASSSFVDIITNFESDLILPEEFTFDGVLYAKRMVDGLQIDEHEFRYVYALYSVSGEPGYIWFIYNDSLDTITSVTKQLFDAVSYSTLTNILSSYVTSSSLTSTLSNYAQVSTLASYVTLSQLSTTLSDYALKSELFSGDYNDLTNKPTIPTVNNNTITITQGGVTKGSFTLNQNSNQTIEVDDVPGMIGETIFSDTSGSTALTLTMAHSFADYSYVDIQWVNNDGITNSTRIYDPNGKTVNLLSANAISTLYIDKVGIYSLSGTAMTQVCKGQGAMVNGNNSIVDYKDNTQISDYIKITKVIGYKQNSAPIVIPDLEYHDGNVYTNSNYISSTGYISSGQKELTFTIIVPKLLTNITSVTVNKLSCLLRGIAGYVNGSSNIDYASTSGYTINTYIGAPNAVTISIIKSSAYSSSTNNTVVNAAFVVNGLELTFNE